MGRYDNLRRHPEIESFSWHFVRHRPTACGGVTVKFAAKRVLTLGWAVDCFRGSLRAKQASTPEVRAR